MDSLILVIKGFFIGIANIIPGVSGGTIALILGVYEKIINVISHFTKDIRKNLSFIIPIIIGIVLSILILSGAISYSYKVYPIIVTMFFMGLVLGGVPFIYKKIINKDKVKISSLIIFLLTFSVVISMSFINESSYEVSLNNLQIFGYIKLILIGIIASGTMVIPGISGSLVLMLLGYYYPILTIIKELLSFKNLFSNIIVISLFLIGVIIGIILFVKLIEHLFKRHEQKTYYGIFGFVLASFLAIPIKTFMKISYTFIPFELVIGIILVTSVFSIRNSFAISTNEKIRQEYYG